MKYYFPFGSELKKVEQTDRTPKKVFVLGVYASAVHAKWRDKEGNLKVNALAVASEPYIFWEGDDADKIISEIEIPKELGKLEPAEERFNGPSGRALIDHYLKPLGYDRGQAWLCDILPYSRLNPNQRKALKTHYKLVYKNHNLQPCTIPPFSMSDLNNAERRKEIIEELNQSKADTIILLGDYPIRYFLSHYTDKKSLSDFGEDPLNYGNTHDVFIEGKTYMVIPLVHPRQSGKLGLSSQKWSDLHQCWLNEKSWGRIPRAEKEKIRVKSKPKICPVCKSKRIASYMYGLPAFSDKLEKDLNEGRIVLGGCCISGDDPMYMCSDCKTDFFREGTA
jgi:uracil-DNA glycosylase